MAPKTKKVLVGRVAVDSGQVLISDPCHASDAANHLYTELTEKNEIATGFSNEYVQLAVFSSTGFGDGYYPVYAHIGIEGGWEGRVVRLEIDFR